MANKTDGIDGDLRAVSGVLRPGAGEYLPDGGRPRSRRAEPAGAGAGPHLGDPVEAAAEEADEEEGSSTKRRWCAWWPPGDLDTREDTKGDAVRRLAHQVCHRRSPQTSASPPDQPCMLGEDRVIVGDMPGTTRDSCLHPMERDEQKCVVIDTAGVRRRGKVHETVEEVLPSSRP